MNEFIELLSLFNNGKVMGFQIRNACREYLKHLIDKIYINEKIAKREFQESKEYLVETIRYWIYNQDQLEKEDGKVSSDFNELNLSEYGIESRVDGLLFCDKEFEDFEKRYFLDSSQAENDKKIYKAEEVNLKSLTIKEFALYCYYEKIEINPLNSNKIVKKCGSNSGNKLEQEYNKWARSVDRTGYPGSQRKLKNKLGVFDKIIPLLSDPTRALSEKNTLECNLE